MLDAQASSQQACLVTAAQAVEVVHGVPELVLGDFQVFDQASGVLQHTQNDLLEARVSFGMVQASHPVEEGLNVGSVGNFHGHRAYLVLFLSGIQVRISDRRCE
ncbi:hypothetical protein D9M71_688540 [compost metagenome]